jgi:hypothetical protein
LLLLLLLLLPPLLPQVSVLAWEGMTSSVAKWQAHRWVHVWRGRLYITPGRDDQELCSSTAYWMGCRVVEVPPAVRMLLCSCTLAG